MTTNGSHRTVTTREGKSIPYGASQIGVFDLVPRLGYREYWYPGILDKDVGRKPISLTMLGEDLVFFRNENGEVAALTDYCPHRGARLSGGWRRTPGGGPAAGKLNNEFKGFITCPYHGFTFNGKGECVAALTDGPHSRLQPSIKARHCPTRTHWGVVFVWMGQTEPVPLEDDIPHYFFDDDVMGEIYIRRWDLNWTLTIENSHDSHAVKIHRGSIRRLFSRGLFRYSAAYHGAMKIAKETDKYIHITSAESERAPQSAYYEGLKAKWPQHVWWRFMKGGRGRGGKSFDPDRPGYTGVYELPMWVSPSGSGDRCHLRAAVPIDELSSRMWTFTLTRKSFWRGWRRLWWKILYNTSHLYQLPQGTNELEDMPVQAIGALDPDMPQKVGASDVAIIAWRRRMPLKSRDAQRLWGAHRDEALEAVAGAEREEARDPLWQEAPAG
jgi:phenylpropionate dioxygenase-like ring-hydroxylating dioxygenase large terminal subunit